MTILREYRVVMPMTVEEYQRAREWHRMEKLKMDTQVVRKLKENDFPEELVIQAPIRAIPYFGKSLDLPENCDGEHSIKRYGSISSNSNVITHALNCFVGFLEGILSGSMKITEIETWEGYPYYRSVSSNLDMKSTYEMVIEAIYLPGNGKLENALNLPAHMLAKREVVEIDIAGSVSADDYRDGKDPALFVSEETGRGPLRPNWMTTTKPCMTCYIAVEIQFKIPGLGYLAEKRLQNGVLRAMTLHHRELFCYIDKWFPIPLEEIRTLEAVAQAQYNAALLETPAEEEEGKEIKAGDGVSADEDQEGEAKTKAGEQSSGGCPISFGKTLFACGGGNLQTCGLYPVFIVGGCVAIAVLCYYIQAYIMK